MLSSEARAIRLVRSREVMRRLSFWLLVAGLDVRHLSLNDRLYFVYIMVFFALWGFALLALLAGFAANVISLLAVDPAEATARFGALGLLAWLTVALWRATRRSPLVLSNTDAQLLCQTPVSRRQVTLAWFITEWPGASLAFWAFAVVLGYAQVEIALGGDIGAEHLPRYLAFGLRALSVVAPLHLGLLALTWSAGLYRLQGDRERPRLRLALPAAAALVLALLLAGSGALPAGIVSRLGMVVTAPVTLPLRAAFGATSWAAGLMAASALALAAMGTLALVSPRLSLSRAAQETSGLEAQHTATLVGAGEVADDLARRRRLGAYRRPTRLPGYPGAGALVWKRAVQYIRDITIGAVVTWLLLAGAAVGVARAPDLGTRLWSALLWVYFASSACAGPLRNDLGRWWLLRQLPLSGRSALGGALAAPVLLIVALSLPGALLAALAGDPIWPILILLPLAAATVALACATDILRRCRASDLLAGIVPGQTSVGLLLQLVTVAVPPLTYVWAAPAGRLQAVAVAVFTGLLLARALLLLASGHLTRIA